MKKHILFFAAMLAFLVFGTIAQAQTREVTSRVQGKVTGTTYHAASKQCVATGEADTAGAVTGGLVGAGAGALAGRWLLGKKGTVAGGAVGAGLGAMMGGGEKKKCTDIPASYDVEVKLDNGKEIVYTVTDVLACPDGWAQVCYKPGTPVVYTTYSNGATTVK